MEDTNGNQVIITYAAGGGLPYGNSSARITNIEDVRGNGSTDYTFTYTYLNQTDPFPHLSGITNTISTAESYTFTYLQSQSLTAPFTPAASFGTVDVLNSMTQTGTSLQTQFFYNSNGSGELTKVIFPYQGVMVWAYGPATYAGQRTQREVQSRTLTMNAGGPQYTYTMSQRDSGDSSRNVHLYAMLDDPDLQSEKVWWFQTDTTQSTVGLVTSFESRLSQSHGSTPASGSRHEDYTYSTDNAGDQYLSLVLTTEDFALSTQVQKQSTQTLDPGGNGNVTQTQQYAWSNFTTPARTITNTYLTNNTNYTSRYIFNRLLTSTVTDGTNTATLVSNAYDVSGLTTVTGLHEHDDANYPATFTYRGNVTSSTTPTSATSMLYDMTGYVRSTTTNGVTSTVSTTSSTNYAAPSQITTNSLSSSMNWSGFLGLSSATGPNGDSGSVSYDGNARPSSTTSPYGAVTNYTYNNSVVPFSVVATTNGHWTSTLMDGFGRTIETATGYGTTVVSKTDANYTPCGCSPLGKVNGQSQPYAPGAMVYWTMYYYDGLGRTTSQVAPDGTSTTTYAYAGNTVTVTDPAGKWKTFTMDAFGNLISVQEPDPSLGTVTTTYSYDVLNHLIGVSMPRGSNTQTRTFNYNVGNPATTVSGFLQSAQNPENGTVSYTYNANNLLATKTDAKNQTLTYAYDTYNRLTSVSAGSTLLRTFYYDTNPLDSTGFSQNNGGPAHGGAIPRYRHLQPQSRPHPNQRHVQLHAGGSTSCQALPGESNPLLES